MVGVSRERRRPGAVVGSTFWKICTKIDETWDTVGRLPRQDAAAAAVAPTLNEFEPADEPSPEDLRCFLALRGDLSALLEKVLQTSLSGNPTVRVAAAILAPPAAGIASLLLPT
jgi:hypothetical protein